MRRRVALGSTCQQRKGSKRDVHEEGETSTDELASECPIGARQRLGKMPLRHATKWEGVRVHCSVRWPEDHSKPGTNLCST
jgi:hypothetical protein